MNRSFGGARVGHRAQVQVRHVADVDDAEPEVRAGRRGPVEQSLDEPERRDLAGVQGRAEDARRVDRRQLEAGALRGDEVPGCALGEGLGLHVGAHGAARHVGPARLVERLLLRRVAVVDRAAARGVDHPARAAIAGGAQHPDDPVDRRPHDLVLLPGRGHRRGHVQHHVDATGGLRPAVVRAEVGRDHLETVRPVAPRRGVHGAAHDRAHPTLGREVAHGRPHPIPTLQQLGDAPRPDEPGPAGDQHGLVHDHSSFVSRSANE